MDESDFSYAKQVEYMDKLVLEWMEEGKDVNEILDMPFHYVIEVLKEKHKEQFSGSFFDLLG